MPCRVEKNIGLPAARRGVVEVRNTVPRGEEDRAASRTSWSG
jgi:hypothetical protein